MGHDSPRTMHNSHGRLTIEHQAEAIEGIGKPKSDAQSLDDTLAESIVEKLFAMLQQKQGGSGVD